MEQTISEILPNSTLKKANSSGSGIPNSIVFLRTLNCSKSMAKRNLTTVAESILVSLTDYPELANPPFLMFLSFYLSYSSGECEDDYSDPTACPTPHLNVLLPEPYCPSRCLLHLSHPPLDPGHTSPMVSVLLSSFLLHLCRHGVLPADSNGL